MGKRVDAESCLLNDESAEDTCIDESTKPVTPKEAGHEHGEGQPHEEDHLEVVLMLPDYDRVLVEVGNISTTETLRVLLHQHPPDVGIEETFADRVRVFVGVGVAVMSPVISSPPSYGTFHCSSSNCG